MTKDNQCAENTAGGLNEANISMGQYNIAASNSIFCFCESVLVFFREILKDDVIDDLIQSPSHLQQCCFWCSARWLY